MRSTRTENATTTANALRRLRSRLGEIGYDAAGLGRRIGFHHPDDIGRLAHPAVVERFRRERDALAVAIRLFWLEQDEAAPHVSRVLGKKLTAELVEARLLRSAGEGTATTQLRAGLRIEPAGDLLLLADRRFRAPDIRALGLRGKDPVYPPSSDSLILLENLPALLRVPEGGTVLDLCTGSGVQALTAARLTGARVRGIDLSPRAVAMAGWNAMMSGIGNVGFEEGDLYAGVDRATFDAILANPPFVPSPWAAPGAKTGVGKTSNGNEAPSYHSGGATGDVVLRRITRGWRRHLKPGGRAIAISHVGLRQGETLEAVARRWLPDFPGRVAVTLIEQGSAIDLAAAQAMYALERGYDAYAVEVRRWSEFLQRQRITSVAAFLLAAESGTAPSLEILDATPRILPLPLRKSPTEILTDWLQG